MGGSIVGLRLSTFRESVRSGVQQKCHPTIPGSYQMSMPVGLPATAAAADFRHRCIVLRYLCGDPTLLPSGEWTYPRAWPSAPRPIGPIVPRPPASLPALRAADLCVADALEAVLSDNTQRVYAAQWRLFVDWCGEVGLTSLPAEPLTVARYLAARASIATLRLATSAVAKAHEWAGRESPCRDPGVPLYREMIGESFRLTAAC